MEILKYKYQNIVLNLVKVLSYFPPLEITHTLRKHVVMYLAAAVATMVVQEKN